MIDQTQTGFINGTDTAETYMLTDPDHRRDGSAAGIDETFYYEALQIDEAGNVSHPASNVLPVTYNTIAPAAPTGLTLVTHVHHLAAACRSSASPACCPTTRSCSIGRSTAGRRSWSAPGPINTTNAVATLQVTDTAGASPDGVYTYYAAQLDVYGNFSLLTHERPASL